MLSKIAIKNTDLDQYIAKFLISDLLHGMGIQGNLDFREGDYFYCLDPVKHTFLSLPAEDIDFEEYKICSVEKLPDLLDDIYNLYISRYSDGWFKSLKVGDIVTIAEREGESNDYPHGFVNDMTKFSGLEYVIKEIMPFNLSPNLQPFRKKFNGDLSTYWLQGTGYNWHSSMFVPINTNPIKKVELINLNIKALII